MTARDLDLWIWIRIWLPEDIIAPKICPYDYAAHSSKEEICDVNSKLQFCKADYIFQLACLHPSEQSRCSEVPTVACISAQRRSHISIFERPRPSWMNKRSHAIWISNAYKGSFIQQILGASNIEIYGALDRLDYPLGEARQCYLRKNWFCLEIFQTHNPCRNRI